MESSTAEFLERQPAFERLSMHPWQNLRANARSLNYTLRAHAARIEMGGGRAPSD